MAKLPTECGALTAVGTQRSTVMHALRVGTRACLEQRLVMNEGVRLGLRERARKKPAPEKRRTLHTGLARSRGASSSRTAICAQSTAPMSINSLPLDVLAEIASYAPLRARLRSLSFINKRWRAAALRSVQELRFADSDRTAPLILPLLFGLFPSLTSLDLPFGVAYMTLPTTLRTLRLGAQFTKQAVEVAHRGVPTFLSTHFPNLTSLDLSVDAPLFLKSDERVTLLRRFLATHSTQLIELAVGTVDRMTWSGLSFPALSTLSFAIGGNRLNFADFPYAPQLRISFPSITQLPPRPLSSLTSIDFTFSATLQRRFDSIAQSVFQHPALQRVTWPGRLSESERVQRTYVSDMQRTFTTRTMDVKWTWEALVGWRSIETLVMSVLPDDALSATLFPRLRTVSIGGSGQPLDGRKTVRLAKEILR